MHEAPRSFGVGAEVAARVQEQAFYSLEAPVLRVTGYDTPYPPSRLEEEWLPNVDRILDAVDRISGVLKGAPWPIQAVQAARPRRGSHRGATS